MPRLQSDLYSRLIGWLRIILPVISLAILSSLFLFSRSRDPGEGIKLLKGDLADHAKTERIMHPRYAGMTRSGAAISFSADYATPRDTGGPVFDSENLNGEIELPDGRKISILAAEGTIDALESQAELRKDIHLETSDGYKAKAENLLIAAGKELEIRSETPITASGPNMSIEAGGLSLTAAADLGDGTARDYHIVFNNGVKLLYTPKETQ